MPGHTGTQRAPLLRAGTGPCRGSRGCAGLGSATGRDIRMPVAAGGIFPKCPWRLTAPDGLCQRLFAQGLCLPHLPRERVFFQPLSSPSMLRSPPYSSYLDLILQVFGSGHQGLDLVGRERGHSPSGARPPGTAGYPRAGTHLRMEQLPPPPRRLRCGGKCAMG